MSREQIALEILKEVMDRVRKQDLDDEFISTMVLTAYSITDEFIKQGEMK